MGSVVRGILPAEGRPVAAERLARAVAGAARGAGLVFEQRVGATDIRVTARAIPIAAGTLRPPGSRAGPPSFPEGTEGGDRPGSEHGVLVRALHALPASRADLTDSAIPAFAAPTGPDLKMRFQTFWLPSGTGSVAAARRYILSDEPGPGGERRREQATALVVDDWAVRSQRACRAERCRPARGLRDWRALRARSLPRDAWFELPVPLAARTVDGPRSPQPPASLVDLPAHLAVFGATGSGKTSCLIEIGAEAIRRGTTVVTLDLHGDLAPGIVARTPAALRDRILAIDATVRPVPGLDVLGSVRGQIDDRLAAHVVASLKRLSPDGEEIYWGFRLERIFDSFVRIAQEEGGSLVDLAELLARPERREVARWNTRRPELAHFLEEIEPVARRQPEILWAAGARLSKIVLVPALRELLAPEVPAWSWEGVRSDGRSLLLRLPFSEIGPEASSLAASLLLGRLYLEIAREPSPPRPVVFLLDEGHALSPRLLTEVLTEGRKFGVHAVVATQYPERLAKEAGAAVAGSVGTLLCFRIPRANARPTARWLGRDSEASADALATLPTGAAWRFGDQFEPVLVPTPPAPDADVWRRCVEICLPGPSERDVPEDGSAGGTRADRRIESLLLAGSVLEEERPDGFTPSELIAQARSNGPFGQDISVLAVAWTSLLRARWVEPAGDGRWRLSARGAAELGQGRSTGATRETSEHRALLRLARRLLARRGCLLEIVRQGRFDTTLPDGRVTLVPADRVGTAPVERAAALAEAERTWAWRFFGGRDVQVEAEVSGALRRERIERGLAKARKNGAFALFLVADAGRARRVRRVLREKGLVPTLAQVWTLRGAAAVRDL